MIIQVLKSDQLPKNVTITFEEAVELSGEKPVAGSKYRHPRNRGNLIVTLCALSGQTIDQDHVFVH